MGSKRIPSKALVDIQGEPLLGRLCNRMKLCRRADEVIVATSEECQDDAIAEACAQWNVPVFRGSEKDLTARLLGAAEAHELSSLVRVTADNPLTDPRGVDDLIEALLTYSHAETTPLLIHNVHRKGYPYGTGAEAASRKLLDLCDRDLTDADEREYFISYVKGHPNRFRCLRIDAEPALVRPHYFLTVDHPEDLALVRAIYANVPGSDEMPLGDVIRFLDAHPQLASMNSHLHDQLP